jgi:predicted DNA-binding ribbon-helix-helix protein
VQLTKNLEQRGIASDRKTVLSMRLEPQVHEELRRIAYERHVSIHSLLLEGIATVLNKYR